MSEIGKSVNGAIKRPFEHQVTTYSSVNASSKSASETPGSGLVREPSSKKPLLDSSSSVNSMKSSSNENLAALASKMKIKITSKGLSKKKFDFLVCRTF